MTHNCGRYSTRQATGCRCDACESGHAEHIAEARGSAVERVGLDFPAAGVAVWVGAVTA